jgi:nitroimidazol reductase NimA-like FMN-containing flavoprotein (pyridoxamine 5'-phosphate oxidase superfamily)
MLVTSRPRIMTNKTSEVLMPDYHMRRKEQEIKDPAVLEEILKAGTWTAIALCRDNQPYVVSLSYGYDADRKALYFHNALKGRKIDYCRANQLACATVVDDRGYRRGACEQSYRSLILHGSLHVVDDLEEKKHGMRVLLTHLEDDPDSFMDRLLGTDDKYAKLGVLRFDIDAMTGKQGD